MIARLYYVIEKIATRFLLRLRTRARRNIISRFAKKVGLVYFGSVSQKKDEHKVVRGLTLSSSHKDDHFCVGSIDDYDITIVDRTDRVWQPDKTKKLFNWVIISIELHSEKRIPHFLIGAHGHDIEPFAALFNTFPNMKELNPGTFEEYNDDFLIRFTMYARPAKATDVEIMIPAATAKILGAHFWPFSAEQHDNILYVYADNKNITSGILDTMLQNSLWLAKSLDKQAEELE